MAETSALLFSHLTISRVWDATASSSRLSLLSRARPSRSARLTAKASHYGSFSDDDAFFPWSDGNNGTADPLFIFSRLCDLKFRYMILIKLLCFLILIMRNLIHRMFLILIILDLVVIKTTVDSKRLRFYVLQPLNGFMKKESHFSPLMG